MIRCWILLLVFTSSLYSQDFLSLLPASAGDWKKKDPASVYQGDSLYTLIDGGAEIFIEFGFEAAAVQSYTDSEGNIIDVEIYKMKDPSAAYGIFSLNTIKTGRRIDFSSNASAGNEFLIFQKGRYYICLTALKTAEETRKGLFEIAKAADAGIPPADKPGLVSRFEKFNNSKLVYIKGRLGFYNLTTLNPGDRFSIDEGVYLERENAKHFILRYQNADECRKNYLTIVSSFKTDTRYTMISINADEILVKDKPAFIKCSQHGNYLMLSVSANREKIEIIRKKIRDIIQRDINN